MALLERSESYGELQRVVDYLFKDAQFVERLDVVLAAETFDICADLREIVDLLPPGSYRPVRTAEFLYCRACLGVCLRHRRIGSPLGWPRRALACLGLLDSA